MSILRSASSWLVGACAMLLVITGCAMGQDKNAASSSTTKPYMLNTCVVSGEALGTMGQPVSYTYKGQEVKFCCSGCEEDFKKDPDKYIKKMEQAAKNPTTKPAAAG